MVQGFDFGAQVHRLDPKENLNYLSINTLK